MSERHVVVGRVAGAFGVHGALRIESWTHPIGNLCQYNPWLIGSGESRCRYTVEQVSMVGQRLVAKLEMLNDCDEAKRLYGAKIALDEEQLKPLAPGEYYWFQLTGLRVINLAGDNLGTVASLLDTGANNVLVVKNDAGECLVPYIKERVVRQVDLQARVITVAWGADW